MSTHFVPRLAFARRIDSCSSERSHVAPLPRGADAERQALEASESTAAATARLVSELEAQTELAKAIAQEKAAMEDSTSNELSALRQQLSESQTRASAMQIEAVVAGGEVDRVQAYHGKMEAELKAKTHRGGELHAELTEATSQIVASTKTISGLQEQLEAVCVREKAAASELRSVTRRRRRFEPNIASIARASCSANAPATTARTRTQCPAASRRRRVPLGTSS